MWATLRQPCCRFSIETLGVCAMLLTQSESLQTGLSIPQERGGVSDSVRLAQGNRNVVTGPRMWCCRDI